MVTQRGLVMIMKCYLADAVVPAHPSEAGSSKDDGGVVLLLIQLLQTCVQVPTLENKAKDNTSETHT